MVGLRISRGVRPTCWGESFVINFFSLHFSCLFFVGVARYVSAMTSLPPAAIELFPPAPFALRLIPLGRTRVGGLYVTTRGRWGGGRRRWCARVVGVFARWRRRLARCRRRSRARPIPPRGWRIGCRRFGPCGCFGLQRRPWRRSRSRGFYR